MIVSILLTSIVTFSLSTYYCATKSKKIIQNRTHTIVAMQGDQNSDAIAAKITNYYSTLNAMASVYADYYDLDEGERQLMTNASNSKVLGQNPEFIKLTDMWDVDESEYKEVTGPSLEKLPNRSESAYLCQLSAPIKYEGSFVGYVSASIIVDSLLNDFVNTFGDQDVKIYLASGQGNVLYSANANDRGKPMQDVLSAYYREYNLGQYVKQHEPYIGECKVAGSKACVVSLDPIKLPNNKQWTLCVILPKTSVMGEAQYITLIAGLLTLLCLIILGVLTFLISRKISQSLRAINGVLENVSKGNLQNNNALSETMLKEINEISSSTNAVIDGLIRASVFSEEIGNGNLDTEFTTLSEDDKLGNALINMRDSLQKNDEENKRRKIEDEKVNWATSGLAKFGEILHTNSQNINDLSYEILRNLIKYIDVNQGAIYVLDDTGEEAVYEMTAAIAYDRRKFLQKRFAVGEDLVGRCAYERKTIYMTDIPKDYINITSGMGSSTASTLLLVPLVLNDEIFGIIELASFHELEDYKINFVEKVGESIASTISTVKINERTNNLLNQSKIQAEELASKEEEMRQNMEELQATQEEAARRENESNAVMKVINSKMIVVEYDMNGTITNVNQTYAALLGSTTEQLIGKKSDDGVEMNAEKRAAHNQMWNQLRRGQIVTETNHITLNKKDLWIQETYTPVLDQNETAPYKVIKVGIDVTDQMKAGNIISKLEKENAASAEKIIELENQLSSQPAAAPAKKAGKQAKSEPAETATEFDAEVGEQELIEWNDANDTGIIEIDEQLKQLSELANTVYTTFRANKSKKEIKDTLRSLSDFAQYHFGTVEGYADESGYADAAAIKQSFKNFSAKINDFAKLYADGKVKSADALMLFMSNWMKADIEQMKLLAANLKK